MIRYCVELPAVPSDSSQDPFLWLTVPCTPGQSFSSYAREQIPLPPIWRINQKNLAVRSILMAMANFPFHDFLALSFCLRLNLKVIFVPPCSLWQQANEMKLLGDIACIRHTPKAGVWKREMTREAGLLFIGTEPPPWRVFEGACAGVFIIPEHHQLSWGKMKASSKAPKQTWRARKEKPSRQPQLRCPRLLGAMFCFVRNPEALWTQR